MENVKIIGNNPDFCYGGGRKICIIQTFRNKMSRYEFVSSKFLLINKIISSKDIIIYTKITEVKYCTINIKSR